MLKKVGSIVGMMFLLSACATTPATTAKPTTTKTNAAATKKGKQPAAAKPTKKTAGPATRKVEVRQAAMQDEFDFTLGDPLDPAVRKRIDEDRYSQTIEEQIDQDQPVKD